MTVVVLSERFKEARDEVFRNIAISNKITFTESRVLFLTVSFLTSAFEYNSVKGAFDFHQDDLVALIGMRKHLVFVANASNEVNDLIDEVLSEALLSLVGLQKETTTPININKLILQNIESQYLINEMVDGAIRGFELISEFLQ